MKENHLARVVRSERGARLRNLLMLATSSAFIVMLVLPLRATAGVSLAPPFDREYVSTATDVFSIDASEACTKGNVLLTRGVTHADDSPRGYALMIAVDEVGDIMKLRGPRNDAAILGAELNLRGYEVTQLVNPALRTVMETMARIVDRAECGDFIFLGYSGMGVVFPGVFLAGEAIGKAGDDFREAGQQTILIHESNAAWALPSLTQASLDKLRADASVDVHAAKSLDEFAAMTEEFRASDDIVPPQVIAGFVLALAKKGVHTTVLSDAGNDELLHLASAFGYATFSTVTPFTRLVGRLEWDTPHDAVISRGYEAGQQLFIYAAKAVPRRTNSTLTWTVRK